MTVINLMHALKDRIERIVSVYKMRVSDGDGWRVPKVWAQHLPEKLYDGKPDPADYPFVLAMISGTSRDTDGRTAQVALMVGGYDDGQPVDGGLARDRQGWMIPVDMMDRIIFDFEVEPLVGHQFLYQRDASTQLPDEQPAPQWYGIVTLSFSMPVPEQDFSMEDWTVDPIVLPDTYIEGEVKTLRKGRD